METRWFRVPLGDHSLESVQERAAQMGFRHGQQEAVDHQHRVVRWFVDHIEIGIPAVGLLEDHEQVEYIVGQVGLDEEMIEAV